MFKCHNCSVALPFSALLKRLNSTLYDEYLLEEYRESDPTPKDAPNVSGDAPACSLTVPELPSLLMCRDPRHVAYPVYRFATDRQIPDSGLSRLYATTQARTWVLPLIGTEKASKVSDGLPYLVQPLRLLNGEWYGAQLRFISRKDYVTFRWSHDPLKMFGLDCQTPGNPLWIFEGPIDSLFIPNAIAACGSAMLEAVRIAEDAGVIARKTPRVYVWDNEPRNREVCHQIETAIRLHESVVIWPKSFPKDVNDAIREGWTASRIEHIMKLSTFTGLRAELEFSAWKQ
jgi:hypothetical protein